MRTLLLQNDGMATLTPLYIKWVFKLPSKNPQVDHVRVYFTASRNPVQTVKNTTFRSPRLYNECSHSTGQATASAIRDGQSDTRAGFSPNTSVYLVSIISPIFYTLSLITDAVLSYQQTAS